MEVRNEEKGETGKKERRGKKIKETKKKEGRNEE